LTKNIEEFKQLYESPSEYMNNDVRFDIAKNEIIGKIEKDIRDEVDKVIQMEIINLRAIYYKGKKDPILSKKKKTKTKPVKEKLLPGENKIANINIEDLFTELVMNGIIRKMIPKRLDDLTCDFNYIAKETLIAANDKMCDIKFSTHKSHIHVYADYNSIFAKKNSLLLKLFHHVSCLSFRETDTVWRVEKFFYFFIFVAPFL
jgi:hypothetical protein